MPALVSTLKQVWTDSDGKTRERETLSGVEFLSADDQRRWEAAGSPPPWSFDPSEHDVGRDASGRLVKDFASKAFRGRHEFTYMSRLSQLPTEPEALRLAVEHRRGGESPLDPSPATSPRGGGTVERLLDILSEPLASPALRAAAFRALAEIPGIGFERDVTDAGRATRRRDRLGQGKGVRAPVHLRSAHREDPFPGRNDLQREGRGLSGGPRRNRVPRDRVPAVRNSRFHLAWRLGRRVDELHPRRLEVPLVQRCQRQIVSEGGGGDQAVFDRHRPAAAS